jgi:putative nucleotidyltransferase-like protein
VRSAGVDPLELAVWLAQHDFAALAFAASVPDDPELVAMLRKAAAGAAAGNLWHLAALERIERRFEADRLSMVLLKGAALACSAYHDRSFRPMSDLDIWVRDDDMPRAVSNLIALGFRQSPGLPGRPPALQRRSNGELVFRQTGAHGVVELHYGAFPGWWIQRVALPDDEGLWRRAVPMGPGRHALRLAAEDAVLQTAFHVAVNQFGQAPLRGLMDIAVLARTQAIDWEAVAERARTWRLATATWLVLDTAHGMIGVPGCDAAIASLRPTLARRAALRAFVTPGALLSGRDLTRTARRHLFMLGLVDRLCDGGRLVGRTLWPERWWIAARYGRPAGRFEHVWGLIRRGAV